MVDAQLEIPKTKKQSPETLVRENLERAIIRHGGDVKAYQEELLKKIPETPVKSVWDSVQKAISQRLR